MAPQQIGTFVVSDRLWQNQSAFLRSRFWTRIIRVTWDNDKYWITAESALFDSIKPGEVIPDYKIEIHRDGVMATRQGIALAAA